MPFGSELARPALTLAEESVSAALRTTEVLSPQLESRLATIAAELKNFSNKLPVNSEYIEFSELPGSPGFPKVTKSILGRGRLDGKGIEIVNAEIGPNFKISSSTKIAGLEPHPVRIGESFEAAAGVEIGPGSMIGGAVSIGRNSRLAGGNILGDAARIGSDISIGSKSQIFDRAWIADSAKLGSKVRVFQDAFVGGELARGVTIGAGSAMEASTSISRNAVIGPFAKISGKSTIGPDAKIGGGSRIIDSYVGASANVGPRAHLYSSRVGSGMNLAEKFDVDATVTRTHAWLRQ
ncbi:MAG: hypothetical protein C0469_00205 [Cyanobacteria bacterium DS2.3.42]|nr:hypothetical protein [Cyanobacteria bacterium DS2.3.42]